MRRPKGLHPISNTKSLTGAMSNKFQKRQPLQPPSSLSAPYLVAEQLSLPETAVALTGQAASCRSTANGHISCAKMHALLRLTQQGTLWRSKHMCFPPKENLNNHISSAHSWETVKDGLPPLREIKPFPQLGPTTKSTVSTRHLLRNLSLEDCSQIF